MWVGGRALGGCAISLHKQNMLSSPHGRILDLAFPPRLECLHPSTGDTECYAHLNVGLKPVLDDDR